ncbi:MAG: hypothetical protein Q9217_005727 [Psora testacea]
MDSHRIDVNKAGSSTEQPYQQYDGAQIRQPDGSIRMSGFGGAPPPPPECLAKGKGMIRKPIGALNGGGNDSSSSTSGQHGGPIRTPVSSAQGPHRPTPGSWYGGLSLDYVDKDIIFRSAPFALPKLTVDNWREWSQRMMWFLKQHQLWSIVDGTIPRPPIEAQPTQAHVWDVYASFINYTLISNATDIPKSYIVFNKNLTPRQIWTKWEEIHGNNSDSIGDLLERIFSLKAKDDSVDKVAAELNQLNERIYEIDPAEKLSDKAIRFAITEAFRGRRSTTFR